MRKTDSSGSLLSTPQQQKGLAEGVVVAGRYKLVSRLGRGGMGSVFLTWDGWLGRWVAFKHLEGEVAVRMPEARQRFFREARCLAAATSEHTAAILDMGLTDDGTPFLVMELLRGISLRDAIEQLGRLTVAASVDIVLEILTALSAAHAKGIVHRDLKTSNVMLVRDEAGEWKAMLIDFGLAKALREDHAEVAITRYGDLFGAAAYMSPEHAKHGMSKVDCRSDLWAVGVILYRCLCGNYPFGQEIVEALYRVLHTEADPISPSEGVPEALVRVVRWCFEKDPSRRPQTAADLARALAPFGTPRLARATLVRIVETLAEEPTVHIARRRSPLPVALALVGAVIDVLLVVWIVAAHLHWT